MVVTEPWTNWSSETCPSVRENTFLLCKFLNNDSREYEILCQPVDGDGRCFKLCVLININNKEVNYRHIICSKGCTAKSKSLCVFPPGHPGLFTVASGALQTLAS